LAKNYVAFLRISYLAPVLPMFHLELHAEVNHDESRVMALSYSKVRMIVARVILIFDSIPACNVFRDGWTD